MTPGNAAQKSEKPTGLHLLDSSDQETNESELARLAELATQEQSAIQAQVRTSVSGTVPTNFQPEDFFPKGVKVQITPQENQSTTVTIELPQGMTEAFTTRILKALELYDVNSATRVYERASKTDDRTVYLG